jgi:acyl carrier protein
MAETGTSSDRVPATDAGAERLYTIVRDLAIELEPSRRETLEVAPDSILDRDLGIDSLARLELLLRIERGFGVRLAEQALMEAVTPTDLLSALIAARDST